MSTTDHGFTDWIKATASNSSGTCVEMRANSDTVQVRDTKDQGTGPVLALSKAQFVAWLTGAKSGAFDSLV